MHKDVARLKKKINKGIKTIGNGLSAIKSCSFRIALLEIWSFPPPVVED